MRTLTKSEIEMLVQAGCSAEDWQSISVAEAFDATYVKRVTFMGTVILGQNTGYLPCEAGFNRHAGISNATLRNVRVGNNCLIENVHGYINNYEIGDDCLLSDLYSLETTDHPDYGEGHIIPVLNEAGKGNVMLFEGLTSQLAMLQVKYASDVQIIEAIRALICQDIASRQALGAVGKIGQGVRLIHTGQLKNVRVGNHCCITGATLLESCTLSDEVRVGCGVIAEHSVICRGSEVSKQAHIEGCFVGEASTITNGFSAENSVFFANSFMGNGESCAAFCGPFTVSHHKATLLIGSDFSFYNAGSATNFSNHAYKIGPMHWGMLERGSKTASGSHLLLPAQIGAFSVCLGKLTNHPDTRNLPFSYLIADGDDMYIVPGKNLVTVGLYRDVNKWPHRDRRKEAHRTSLIHYDWLSPFTIGKIYQAKKALENLLVLQDDPAVYTYQGGKIKRSSLVKGIQYYDLALRLYFGSVLKEHAGNIPTQPQGAGVWNDLAGLLWPAAVEQEFLQSIRQGNFPTIEALLGDLNNHYRLYSDYRWTWTYPYLCEYYKIEGALTPSDIAHIGSDYSAAMKTWIGEIRKDAEKEFKLGDVDLETYQAFIEKLNQSVKDLK